MNKHKEWVKGFDNYSRFSLPENIVRVTGGRGGEAFLIFGEEKTVLYDCGMAYCADKLITNIENALKRYGAQRVDMLILSHTHYDHIGALPLVRNKWKDIVVCGAQKAKQVFESDGAKNTICELSKAAARLYAGYEMDIPTTGMFVDKILVCGEKIDIGNGEHIKVLETKGHTDCSLTYILEPKGIMFASETTGVIESPKSIHVPALKSLKQSIESAHACKNENPRIIICPHFGVVPDDWTAKYFDLFIKHADNLRKFVEIRKSQGLTFENILKEYEEAVWTPEREAEQPWEAFVINSKNIVATVFAEISEN